MLNKNILSFILLIAAAFISGCIFDQNGGTNQTIGPDFIPRTNLPAGFTFMAIHETTMDIDNSTVSGFEGVYRYGGEDVYITAIKHDDPEALLSQYKADLRKNFKQDYDPFEEISINGHAATKYNYFRVSNGTTQARFTIIWAKDDYMVEVGSSSDIMIVVSLASATGY